MNNLILSFSDHRPDISNINAINDILLRVGVRVSQIDLPQQIIGDLRASRTSQLDAFQTERVLSAFSLNRADILEQINSAGRVPSLEFGGELSTGEIGVAPYPKVYDLRAADSNARAAMREKFGRLHVNSTDDGVGVDEVMTLVSGGPFTWFFLLDDNVVAKLSLPHISENGPGLRLSYPGTTPHGALMSAEDGVIVAHITGPKTWTMRYEADVRGAQWLGSNPWIDFAKSS